MDYHVSIKLSSVRGYLITNALYFIMNTGIHDGTNSSRADWKLYYRYEKEDKWCSEKILLKKKKKMRKYLVIFIRNESNAANNKFFSGFKMMIENCIHIRSQSIVVSKKGEKSSWFKARLWMNWIYIKYPYSVKWNEYSKKRAITDMAYFHHFLWKYHFIFRSTNMNMNGPRP